MRTLLIVKPGYKRYPGLTFAIGSFMHGNKQKVCLQHTATPNKKFWEEFYQAHTKTSYFEEMVKYLTSSPSIFIIIEGDGEVVKKVRQYAVEIRTKHGKTGKDTKNIVHASDSNENAQREIDLVIESMSQNRL